MTSKHFEIAFIEHGKETRGGIYATLETVKKWCKKNHETFPDTDFYPVIANDDAISYREFISGCEKGDIDNDTF
jgi:hypothetical protein